MVYLHFVKKRYQPYYIRDIVYLHLSRNVTNPIILVIRLYTFVKKRYLPYYIRDIVYIYLSRNVTYHIILEIWCIYICQETLTTLLY